MSRRVVPEPEPLWQALADPTRRAIIDCLRDGPRSTGDLASQFPTSRYTVMNHLEVLTAAGLVTVERRGRQRLNHLNPVPLQQVYERWMRPAAASAATALLRLSDSTRQGATAMQTTHYGLDVRAQHRVQADAAHTWNALLNLADWWPPCWEAGERLLFESRIGGRLGTVAGRGFDDGDGCLWGIVAEISSGRALTVDGTMGISGPVQGRWRMLLEPDAGATLVTVEHRVPGPVDDQDREGFTAGWDRTLTGLADYATGSHRPRQRVDHPGAGGTGPAPRSNGGEA